jgi:hypothetical protein
MGAIPVPRGYPTIRDKSFIRIEGGGWKMEKKFFYFGRDRGK